MTTIHPTAIVEDGAVIGADCEVHAYAIIRRWARLGERVVVHPFAVVGGDPQAIGDRLDERRHLVGIHQRDP